MKEEEEVCASGWVDVSAVQGESWGMVYGTVRTQHSNPTAYTRVAGNERGEKSYVAAILCSAVRGTNESMGGKRRNEEEVGSRVADGMVAGGGGGEMAFADGRRGGKTAQRQLLVEATPRASLRG